MVQVLFLELLQMESKVSPQINCVRTLLFLVIGQHTLNHPAGQLYSLVSQSVGSLDWFLPFLANMTYVSNKFALYALSYLASSTQPACSRLSATSALPASLPSWGLR